MAKEAGNCGAKRSLQLPLERCCAVAVCGLLQLCAFKLFLQALLFAVEEGLGKPMLDWYSSKSEGLLGGNSRYYVHDVSQSHVEMPRLFLLYCPLITPSWLRNMPGNRRAVCIFGVAVDLGWSGHSGDRMSWEKTKKQPIFGYGTQNTEYLLV